jgi:CBS domain-containing protein
MDTKRVGDIMIPLDAFPYIPYWFTLRQALAEWEDAWMKRGANRRPLPWLILVFSARNQLLGIVRQRDILQGLKPSLAPSRVKEFYTTGSDGGMDLNLYRLGFTPQKATQELRSQLERQIIEFMTPITATVEYEDYALLAIYLMIDRNFTFVPVMKNEQIVGLVYAEDALREVIALTS